MSIFGCYKKFGFEFPPKNEPKWSHKVDRWYQLDAYSYGLADVCADWSSFSKKNSRPQFLVLASQEGSNRSDVLFAKSGGLSPSKFVHTLPNIRSSSFCQVMEWSGPLLCVQNSTQTFLAGINEALSLLNERCRQIWIFCVTRSAKKFADEWHYTVHWVCVGEGGLFDDDQKSSSFEVHKNTHRSTHTSLETDANFFEWLEKSPGASDTFQLLEDFELKLMMKGILIENSIND